MIQKIEKLVSIGKFRDYQAAGNVAFNNLTLFYADNGTGKTTLTAVLRSLTTNDPAIVRRRKSTNATLPQSAQIIQRIAGSDTYYTFGTRGWSNPLPEIEIFDIHFVNENIYSGFDFSDDQRKQLHQFVIGAAGVGVRLQIEQNKTDKVISRQAQERVEQQIIQQVSNGLNTGLTTEFLNLRPTAATNIDQRISVAEAALNSANLNSVIQSLPRLANLASFSSPLDFDELIRDLQTNTTTLMDASLRALFESHCADLAENTIHTPETWLRSGFNYLLSKNQNAEDISEIACPFCKQPINQDSDIIRSFSLRFNDDFNALVGRLQSHISSLEGFNLETLILALNNANELNIERSTAWAAHLPTSIQVPIFNIIADEAVLRQELLSLINVVRQKLHNPSITVSDSEAVAFNASLQSINNRISNYNSSVALYNNGISAFIATIQSASQAQNEVNKLKRIKRRFDPAIVTLCTNLLAEKANLRTLETAYTALVQRQEAAATSFFTRYKDRINYYLGSVFKTPFQIDSVRHVAPQGRATQSRIDYVLTIDSTPISFDHSQPNCAKDCLSEGDKSTLALAFFMSKLDIDGGTANKIIVFDDPLSSFDSNRRLYTVQLMKELLPRIKQLIILSHNEFFLHDISKSVAAGSKSVLRISENFLNHAAFIEPLMLEVLVENDYFRHVTELENFLTRPDITKKEIVLGWMRNVLEAHIRFKFYRQVSHLQPNDRTFGRLITVLNTPPLVVFRDNLRRTIIIDKLNLINGVSCKPHHGEPTPDYLTLGMDPTTITVTELANLVQDTFDLTDNLL